MGTSARRHSPRPLGSRGLLFGFLVGSGACLLGPIPPAGAAAHHPLAGTYQVTISGGGSFTTILAKDHFVSDPSRGTWSVHKHVVTIQGTAGQAPTVDCVRYGQPPLCSFTDVFTGPVTPPGIASSTSPGTADVYIGSSLFLESPFWAVRTGRA